MAQGRECVAGAWAVALAGILSGAALAQEEKKDVAQYAASLDSGDAPAVLKALQALGNLSYKGGHAQELKEHLPRIALNLRHTDPKNRRAALQILLNVKAAEYIPDLVKLLDDPDRDVKKGALGALGLFKAKEYANRIADCLEDKDFGIRGTAVDALGTLGAKEHAGRMKERLKDEHHWVRGLAASAVAKFGKEHAADIATLLASKENDKINALYALEKLKAKEYGKNVAGLLKDQDYAVRLAALRFLSSQGDKDYATDVAPLLKDENDSVKREAEATLKKWGAAPAAPAAPK